MQKAYSKTTWENSPSDNTPLNEANLNHIESGIDEIDNRVISLDTTKFDKTEAAGLIKSFELDTATGIITITKYNGSVQTIDTLLEKIAVNFDFVLFQERNYRTFKFSTVIVDIHNGISNR